MMAGTRGLWDETDDGRLWTLLAEGLSSREIGERMGRSKNAILSRVHRRGWKLPIAPIGGPLRIIKSGKYASPPSPKSPPSPPVVVPDTAPEPLPPAARPPTPQPVALSQCAWTDSNGHPWVFCDAAVVPGFPYCDQHCRRAYTVWPWRRAA